MYLMTLIWPKFMNAACSVHEHATFPLVPARQRLHVFRLFALVMVEGAL
jgi:hypothetical protein